MTVHCRFVGSTWTSPKSDHSRTWQTIKLMICGAFSFWLPDVLWHAIRGSRFNRPDIIGLTVLLPAMLLAAHILLKRHHPNESGKNLGWLLLTGVWLLGGPFMGIAASFSGGGFAGAYGFFGGVKIGLISLLPIFTIDMATYDGSLWALSIVCLAALFMRGWTVWANNKTLGIVRSQPSTPPMRRPVDVK